MTGWKKALDQYKNKTAEVDEAAMERTVRLSLKTFSDKKEKTPLSFPQKGWLHVLSHWRVYAGLGAAMALFAAALLIIDAAFLRDVSDGSSFYTSPNDAQLPPPGDGQSVVLATPYPGATTAPWDKDYSGSAYIPKYRQRPTTAGGGGMDNSYVYGKYIDLFSRSAGGVAALDYEGKLWLIEDGLREEEMPSGKKRLLQDLAVSVDGSPLDYVSYVNAFQKEDTLYFAQNTTVYSCDLMTGTIKSIFTFQDGEKGYRYVDVVGGTETGILYTACGEKFDGYAENYFYDLSGGQWIKIPLQEADPTHGYKSTGGYRAFYDPLAWIGYENNTAFFSDGSDIYRLDCGTWEWSPYVEDGNAASRYLSEVVINGVRVRLENTIDCTQSVLSDGKLFYISENRDADCKVEAEGDTFYVAYNSLYWGPSGGVTDSGELGSIKHPMGMGYFMSRTAGRRTCPEQDITAICEENGQLYAAVTHVGPQFGEDEQGAIVYRLDMDNGELIPVTAIVQGAYHPFRIIIKDGVAYMICGGEDIITAKVKTGQ